MGRPCKPQALRELEASHHRHKNTDEPRPQGDVRPPRNLSKEARRHWRRLAAVLTPLGLLTSADQDSFAMLTNALATIDKARSEVAKSGEVVARVTGDDGEQRSRMVINPWLSVLRNAETMSHKLFGDFGMSPSARTRLFSLAAHPKPTSPSADPADSYFESDESPSLH